MTDFDYDCLERKRLARQAKYRKSGSRSHKCPMSTDHMTQKQWKERCGAVVSINMGKPVSWDKFKEMSKSTQEEYIRGLMDTYGANATSLAAMFDIRPLTVRRYIAAAGLAVNFPVGHSMNAEQRAAWESFLANGRPQVIAEPPALPQDTEGKPCSNMSMNKFSLTFSGKLSVDTIANSLLQILGDSSNGCIEITCNLA